MKPHFLESCLRATELTWALRDESTGATLASAIVPAFDRRSRNKGLLGRDRMPEGTALVLAPCFGIHTWFMRFPIDVLFVSRTGTVLAARRALAPWRMALRPGAFAVIELAAGAAATTRPGDKITAFVAQSKLPPPGKSGCSGPSV